LADDIDILDAGNSRLQDILTKVHKKNARQCPWPKILQTVA